MTKCKFYFAWSISDAVCNISGFGYKRPDFDNDEDLSSVMNDGVLFCNSEPKSGNNFPVIK